MKSIHQQKIEKFMELAGQKIPTVPSIPSNNERILRAKLIMEETLETISKGLGVNISHMGNHVNIAIQDLQFNIYKDVDLVEIADGVADISVVSIGTLSCCGIHDTELFDAIDNNNLDKFSDGHSFREDGKLIKPPGHKPPDIAGIIMLQSQMAYHLKD